SAVNTTSSVQVLEPEPTSPEVSPVQAPGAPAPTSDSIRLAESLKMATSEAGPRLSKERPKFELVGDAVLVGPSFLEGWAVVPLEGYEFREGTEVQLANEVNYRF